MSSDHSDPSNWKYRVFYHNPSDTRTFVPKRGHDSYFPWGATVNTASTEGQLYIAALVGVVAWAIVGTVRDRRR